MELSDDGGGALEPGDVWWAEPDPGVGREQSGRRPVVVVSGQEYMATITTLVLVVPVTARDRGWPNHVELDGPTGLAASWAMTEQVRVIARSRLQRRSGLVSPACLAEIRGWVLDHLR